MSKTFEFPLERVLNVRRIIEETRSIRLKKSEMVLDKDKRQLRSLKDKKARQIQQGRDKHAAGEPLSLTGLKVSRNYVLQLNDNINGQKENVAKSSAVVKNDREEVIQASREKQVVAKLKENYLDQYRKTKHRDDEKKESEVALRVSVKKNNGVGQ